LPAFLAQFQTVTHRILDPNITAVMPAGLCALAVMTKAPRAGKVKTRLVPPLTQEEAAALNICFLRDITSSIEHATQNGNAMGIAVYTPAGSENAYEGILPDHFALVVQRGDEFGERLFCASQDLFRLGFESVCLINSDSPTVPARLFDEAVEVLSRPGDRVVLGPSDDGGYYLIGLKKLHRRIFEEIAWSTEKVLQQTIDRAAELHLDVHLSASWFDVDDRATLVRLCKSLLAADSKEQAPATQHFLRELIARPDRGRILPHE
jgi:uncharacterized protein